MGRGRLISKVGRVGRRNQAAKVLKAKVSAAGASDAQRPTVVPGVQVFGGRNGTKPSMVIEDKRTRDLLERRDALLRMRGIKIKSPR